VQDYEHFERKVRILVRAVEQLQEWPATQGAAFQTIQKIVSDELLKRDYLEVTVRALGELGESAAARLLNIVEHCSQSFYYSTSVLSAIALPVAVCWRSPIERSYQLKRVNRSALKNLSLALSQRKGVHRVILDARPFSHAEAFMASARDLREYLWHLSAGTQVAWEHPAPTAVRSQADPMWQMFYLLGTEISDPTAARSLQGSELASHLQNGQSDFMNMVRNALHDPGDIQIYCHGVWYLHEALRHGQKALRRHHLQALFESVQRSVPNGGAIHANYSIAALSNEVEFIVRSNWLNLHAKWPLFQGEALNDFVEEVQSIARKIKNSSSGVDVEFMDWEDYVHQYHWRMSHWSRSKK